MVGGDKQCNLHATAVGSRVNNPRISRCRLIENLPEKPLFHEDVKGW
jgi:hypothetical protein